MIDELNIGIGFALYVMLMPIFWVATVLHVTSAGYYQTNQGLVIWTPRTR